MAPEERSNVEVALTEGIRLFNCGEFFEAHEVLEDAWRTTSGPMKDFLKGLIHAAVALYQYGRRNAHGACSKYHSTHFYLSPYRPHFAGIDVSGLLTAMDDFFDALPEGPAGPWHGPDWPRPIIQRGDGSSS